VPAAETPTHLPADVAAVWSEFAAKSPRLGPDFEAWCGQVARLRDAQRRLHEEGTIVADAKGTPMPHPALDIERKAQAELRSWGSRFAATGNR